MPPLTEDRVPVPKHLILARTTSTEAEVDQLFTTLKQYDDAIAQTGHI